MKTKKGGYLKDGFVVDSSDGEEDECASETEDEDENSEEPTDESGEIDDELLLDDIGSELSEEAYDYSDDENNNKNKNKK
jgi:hypothetical protein